MAHSWSSYEEANQTRPFKFQGHLLWIAVHSGTVHLSVRDLLLCALGTTRRRPVWNREFWDRNIVALSLTWYSDWLRAGRSGDRILVGGEIFPTSPDRHWGPPSILYKGYRVFLGGKERPGRDADPSPLLVPLVMKEQSYISTPLWAIRPVQSLSACTRVTYSAPVQTGPGAHPASCTMGTGSFPEVKSGRGVTLTPHPILVLWSWKSRAILLLPLWAVRPVQSHSASTRVRFTFSYSSH